MKVTKFFLMVSLFSLSLCYSGHNSHEMTASSSASNPIPIIDRYVAKTRGWPVTDYEIRTYKEEKEYVIYEVACLPDRKERPMGTGGGRSFAVYFDRVKQKILKELAFQ